MQTLGDRKAAQRMKVFARTIPIILILVAGVSLGSHPPAVVYGSPTKDTTNRMPCPSAIVPTSITITQNGQNKYPYLPTIPHKRITSFAQPAVRKLYSAICGLQLVHRSHSVAINCPNAPSIFTDHLIFYEGRTKVLGIHVKLLGCEVLSVDHRPNLGTAYPNTSFWSRLRAVIKTSRQPSSKTVTITAPPASIQPVKLTLGDYLNLITPARATPGAEGPSWLVHADPKFLKLVSSGADASHYVYRWQAIATGETEIVLDPLCRPYGCMAPSLGIRVQISS